MIFDLIAGLNESAAAEWTPAQLFLNGEVGFWLDASDLSTLFQDQMGVTPVTASGDQVGLWKNKVTQVVQTDYNFIQSTAAARPKYNVSSGKSTVQYDGVDDMLNSTLGVGVVVWPNGFTCCMGQFKTTTGASTARKALYGASSNVVNIQNQAGGSGQPGNIFGQLFGQTLNSSNLISATLPNVITMSGKISAQPITLTVNGVTTVGGTNPSSSNTSQTFRLVGDAANDCSISQIVLINRLLTPTELTQLQTFIGSKQ